jgi:hypothetical protein
MIVREWLSIAFYNVRQSREQDAKLIGGMINGTGSLIMRAEKIGSDTVLAHRSDGCGSRRSPDHPRDEREDCDHYDGGNEPSRKEWFALHPHLWAQQASTH